MQRLARSLMMEKKDSGNPEYTLLPSVKAAI